MSAMRLPDHSVHGSADTTVFLLHGAFGAKEYWRAQIAALANAGYRVVAWDAPGYGISPLPHTYSVEVAAEALINLIESVGGPRNVLLGHSFGGMIAQRAYQMSSATQRARVAGLVLSATSAAFGNPEGDFQKEFVRARVAPLDAGKRIEDFLPAGVQKMMAPGAAGPLVDLVKAVVVTMRPETFRAAIAAVARYEGRDVLPLIRCPVLSIAGALDTTAPASVMEKMAGKIADAEHIAMAGVGHFGWAEQADAYNDHVVEFLRRKCG